MCYIAVLDVPLCNFLFKLSLSKNEIRFLAKADSYRPRSCKDRKRVFSNEHDFSLIF